MECVCRCRPQLFLFYVLAGNDTQIWFAEFWRPSFRNIFCVRPRQGSSAVWINPQTFYYSQHSLSLPMIRYWINDIPSVWVRYYKWHCWVPNFIDHFSCLQSLFRVKLGAMFMEVRSSKFEKLRHSNSLLLTWRLKGRMRSPPGVSRMCIVDRGSFVFPEISLSIYPSARIVPSQQSYVIKKFEGALSFVVFETPFWWKHTQNSHGQGHRRQPGFTENREWQNHIIQPSYHEQIPISKCQITWYTNVRGSEEHVG